MAGKRIGVTTRAETRRDCSSMRSLGHLKECSDQRLALGFFAGQVGFGEEEDALQLFWRPTPNRKREGAKSETIMTEARPP
jgi:hypothetical protein